MPLLYNGNHRSSSNDIPVWNLENCSPKVPDQVQHLKYTNGVPSHMDDDNRQAVQRRDILPGGKYRAVAKLFLRYENSEPDTWAVSTGFLVREDLVVTAGHNVYDWNYDLGELVEVKVIIGYSGKQNIDNAEVEFRAGKRVATTPEWMEKGGRREADLAFIKLNRPFNDVRPYDYMDTPESERMRIGVVGYAGDLKKNGEPGAVLYECFEEARWDLDRSRWQMLEYQIDPAGGCTGGPVFNNERNPTCIGTHAYGGEQNCATVIGRQGHEFEPYFEALDSRSEREHQRFGRQSQQQYRRRAGGDDQDLVSQILKLVRDLPNSIPRDILSPDTSLFMGQLGVPAGAVANIALSAAANAVSENVDTSGDRYNFERDQAFDGIAERAILAEAALVAVQVMSPQLRQSEHVFDSLREVITQLLQTIQQAGPTVINSAQEPLLRLALDEITKSKGTMGGGRGRSESIPSFRRSQGSKRSRGLGNKEGSFVEAISEGARDQRTENFVSNVVSQGLCCDDAEVKWENLNTNPKRLSSLSTSSIIESGRRQPSLLGPLMTAKGQQQHTHQHGLGQQTQITLHNLQQLLEMHMHTNDEFPLSVECLPLRALVAEAALQAILRISHHDLQEEHLFDIMCDVIRMHGPTVMKIAPAVIRKVAPVFTAIAEDTELSRGEYGRVGGRKFGYGAGYGDSGGKYSSAVKYGRQSPQRYSLTVDSPQRFSLATKKDFAKRKLQRAGITGAEQEFLETF